MPQLSDKHIYPIPFVTDDTGTPYNVRYDSPGENPLALGIDSFLAIQIKKLSSTLEDLSSRMRVLETQTVEVNFSTYILNTLHSTKIELKKPLAVVIKETPEDYITELSDVNLWGHGSTEESAIKNLCVDIEDSYFYFKKNQRQLGKELQRQWEFLQEFIKETKQK